MKPSQVHTARLGELITLQRGHDLPRAKRRRGNVPIVSSSGVSDYHAESRVAGPGVITGRYGTIGEVYFVDSDYWPLNTTLFVSNFKGNDPLFVSYMLRTVDFHTHSGKSGVPGVNRNDIHELSVVHFPIQQQRAIAEALRDADSLIASLDALIAKKRDLKQAAMQQLLTGKTRLPGFEGEWRTKTFGQLFSFSGGFSASRDQLSSVGHCYLHYGDIHTSNKTYIDLTREALSMPRLDIPLLSINTSSLLADGDVVFVDASEDDEGTSKHVVISNPAGLPFISGLHTIVAKARAQELAPAFMRFCFQTV